MAAPRLGSGERFRKLSGTLAKRGASNPDALAAWIGRRKYGAKKMGHLSAHSHANGSAMSILDFAGSQRQCPNCGYRSDDADFTVTSGGTANTNDPAKPAALQTPAPSTGYARNGAPLTVRGGGKAPGLSSQTGGIELAARYPVSSPTDIMVSRSATGTAVIRHRRGGTLIGEISNGDNGWQAKLGGTQPLGAHGHQRGALAELLGNWNRGTTSLQRPASPPLQPPPVQTDAMARLGIPAIRLATPATGAGNGPRMTYAGANGDNADSGSGDDDNDDDDSGSNGLTPKGQAIYKKLLAKGMKPNVALMMAKRSQSGPPGQKGGS
jgi:hypothetical protein